MNVGIIGCGLIGNKRAESLGDNKLVAVADTDIKKAISLAGKYYQTLIFDDYKELLKNKNIDIVIVSTINNMLASIALDAINAGKHVLIEKPGAIHYKEMDELILASEKNNVKVKIGYNLRYHPAIYKALEMFQNGDIGEIMFLKINYGNGARLGYEKEWRTNPKLSGGGHAIDQGCHALDISKCFLGDLYLKSSSIKTYFWNIKVEDNAFIIVENKYGNIAQINVSSTEWRNTFSLEIYGKKGKLKVEGLGGSYGIEKLIYYKMHKEMGIPEITSWEFAKPDISFKKEFEDFIDCIKNNLNPWSNLEESRDILKIVDEIYENNYK